MTDFWVSYPVCYSMNFFQFIISAVIALPKAWRYRSETFKQMYLIGNQSVVLILVAVIMVNIVLTIEIGNKLEIFGAKSMLGIIVGVSTIREIGPIFAGLMVGGRVGAKIVSEIGNMKLTEQIDALRAFGVDPMKRLIAPRLTAAIIIMIPLVFLADIVGIIAGWFASVTILNVDPSMFWVSLREGILFRDLSVGLVKPPFFGLIIRLVSCYFGYTVYGGADNLGRAATRSVMYALLGVLLMDLVVTLIVRQLIT